MTSLAEVTKHIAVSHDEKTVFIELICTSELAANVLYDDVLSRLNSGAGLTLWVKAGPTVEEPAE